MLLRLLFLLIPVFFIATPCSPAEPELTCRYRETTGKRSNDFTWKIQGTDQVVISVQQEDGLYLNICNPDGETLEWHYRKDPSTRIVARRHGNSIRISGRLEGKTVDTVAEIDDRPWFQPLSYSLRHFLRGRGGKVRFWMIRPDSLKVIRLKAEKDRVEALMIGSQQIQTEKVLVRPAGLLSPFWYGSYWFRDSDQLFLRYLGQHGLPGTPKTVVTLVSDQGCL